MVRSGLVRYYQDAYPLKYTTLVDAACAEKKLDHALVYAVIRTESGFNPNAISEVGARGLMQMMPDSFDWVRMRQGKSKIADKDILFDPELNIDVGTSMLRILINEFGTVENTLAAYHAGWGSAKKWLNNPNYAPDGRQITNIPFQDTAAYVKKVYKTMEIYQQIYAF